MKKVDIKREAEQIGLYRTSKNHNYHTHQIEKELYPPQKHSSRFISFKKTLESQQKTQQSTYTSQQKNYTYKNSLKRMNSLNNYGTLSFRKKQNNPSADNQSNKNKYKPFNKLRNPDHQKLSDKIILIEQKVLQMKNDLMKKKQQKQKIIQQQLQQREKWHRERYQLAQVEKTQKQKQRTGRFTVQERIKQISKGPFKVEKQKDMAPSILEPKQSSIIKDVVMQIPQPKVFHQLTQNPYSPRSNIYYVSEVIKTFKDDKSLAKEHIVQSLQIMRTLQNTRMPTNAEVERRMLNLSQKREHLNKKTLIFDMDETLIHCNDSLAKKFDVKVGIKFQNGTVIEAGINIRPYAKQILRNLHKDFEIIIFTASQSCYADEVLNILDPNKQYIAHRLYREHCYLCAEGMYIKDLRIINRPLSNQILVDNAAYSYYFQLENGIPIIPYYQGSVDFELKQLQRYLLQMLFQKDVRKINRQTFKLHRYNEYYNTPNKLVQDLYINK